MKQLLVKLSEEDFRRLDEYSKSTGLSKSAIIRRFIASLAIERKRGELLKRDVRRIEIAGKPLSSLILEMRR